MPSNNCLEEDDDDEPFQSNEPLLPQPEETILVILYINYGKKKAFK